MVVYAITGVKGGVGKSSYAIRLVKQLSKQQDVTLIDADIGSPSDYFLMGLKDKGEVIETVYTSRPFVNLNKCKRCGLCVQHCPYAALFQLKDQPPVLIEELCEGCMMCKEVCPFDAIEERKKEAGRIYRTNKDNVTVITGEGDTAVARRLRDYTKQSQTVVIDLAAGMHCDVLMLLEMADVAIAITEPTPLGLHDLALSLQLINKMGKRCEVVINKAGLGMEKEVRALTAQHNCKIREEIPFSQNFAQQYARGELWK